MDHSGLVARVTPGTKFKSTKPDFAELDIDTTHYFITGKESLDEARRNCIIEIIARVIDRYYDKIGMYPFVPQLRESLEKTLTKQEKLRVCTTPDEKILRHLWIPEIHPPMLPTSWVTATHMLAKYLLVARDIPYTSSVRQENLRREGPFRFEKLPGEIRNNIYRYLAMADCHLRELTGKLPDFYETQMLLLNREINAEASAIWLATPLRIRIDEADVACYDHRIHKLSNRLRCKSFILDLSLADRSKLSPIGSSGPNQRASPFSLRNEFLLGILHRISLQIGKISMLEYFRLESKRLLYFKGGRPFQGTRKLFPDAYYDCLKQFIRGIRKVEIEGDLDQKRRQILEVAMTSPRNMIIPVSTEKDLFQTIKQHQCACMRLASEGYEVWWFE